MAKIVASVVVSLMLAVGLAAPADAGTYTVTGSNGKGYSVTYPDGTRVGYPALRVALRECSDEEYPRLCKAAIHRQYRALTQAR